MRNRDRIVLRGMVFYGYHGYIPAEQELGQRFTVHMELEIDAAEAGRHDDIRETVDYTDIYRTIRQIVEHERYRLIEALGTRIIDAVFEQAPRVQAIRIEIQKPQVPITGAMDYVGVRMERMRPAAP